MKSLTTSSVLSLLTPEQQLELFDALEETLRETLNKRENSIVTRLIDMQEKYFDLVWMARKDEDLLNERPDIRKTFNEVSAKYPGELEKLQSEEGDWTHGFNSGMLACSRLLYPYTLPHNYRELIEEASDEDEEDFVLTRDSEIEQAEDEFPMLDS